jgi:hypothetical protein
MTAGGDELFVTVGGRDVGLEAVLKKVDAEMQQSADRAVKLGQQYARLAQAQGSPTAASEILAGTMQRAGQASERSLVGLATQQANLVNSSKNLTSTIASLGGQLSQLGGTAGGLAGSIGNLAGSLGTLGTVGAAIGIAKVGLDLAEAGANADLVRQRFDGLATSAHTTGDALIRALRAASGGEISDLSLELAANRAQILGVAHSADEMSTLLAIARDRAQQLGTSSSKAFDDLVTGLGRGSPLILDNLGIMVSVKAANEQYAASLGKTAGALTEAEQKQALINAVLAQGRASLAQTGGAVESTASKIAQAQASIDNFKTAFGALLAQGVAPVAQGLTDLANVTQGTATSSANATIAALNFQRTLIGLPPIAQAQAQAMRDAAAAQDATAVSAQAAAAAQIQAGAAAYDANVAAAQAQAQAAAQTQAAMQAQSAALAQTGGAYGAYAQAANQAGIANQAAAAQIQFSAQAMLTSAETSVLATARQQAQQAATAALAQETNAAAQSFLNMNPTIDAAGIAAAVAAGRVPPLVGELAALMQQAQATAGAMAQLAAQQAGVKDVTALFNAGAGAAVNFKGATTGAFSGLAGGAPRELGGGIKFPKPPKPPGGGGGTRLSDQQKLQNSLLASQEDYEQKSEDAATQHATLVEKINQDFYTKMRAAQRDFDDSQLEGRAGFYDNLGSIENQKIAQQASAAYEAASVEAGKIAQEKGADVAEKYMSAQEQIIQARAKRLSEIEKAEKEKDAGKAEYLRGVDEQYKKAEDAKLARIQEGEGSIAAERQKQLDDAAAKEADAQDKIGLAADRAAEKKILASDRAGKKADTYDRVGQAGSRAGISPAASTPGAGASPNQASAAAPSGEGAQPPSLADLIASLMGKLDEVKGAIVAQERETTGAVRGLRNTGGIAA